MRRSTGGECRGERKVEDGEEERRRRREWRRRRTRGEEEDEEEGEDRSGGGKGGVEGGRRMEVHLGQREVVGQRNAFLTKQLLLLLCQLEVWVELQQKKKCQPIHC